jgi:hypothetical protein
MAADERPGKPVVGEINDAFRRWNLYCRQAAGRTEMRRERVPSAPDALDDAGAPDYLVRRMMSFCNCSKTGPTSSTVLA